MSDDIKNLTEHLLRSIINYNKPHPTNIDPQKCNTCDNFTTIWYTEYPKNRNIFYRCGQFKVKIAQEKETISINEIGNTLK